MSDFKEDTKLRMAFQGIIEDMINEIYTLSLKQKLTRGCIGEMTEENFFVLSSLYAPGMRVERSQQNFNVLANTLKEIYLIQEQIQNYPTLILVSL